MGPACDRCAGHTTLDENINMIYDTLKYLKDSGREVIFDAEHFFDGYKANSAYAQSMFLKRRSVRVRIVLCCAIRTVDAMLHETEEAIQRIAGRGGYKDRYSYAQRYGAGRCRFTDGCPNGCRHMYRVRCSVMVSAAATRALLRSSRTFSSRWALTASVNAC